MYAAWCGAVVHEASLAKSKSILHGAEPLDITTSSQERHGAQNHVKENVTLPSARSRVRETLINFVEQYPYN